MLLFVFFVVVVFGVDDILPVLTKSDKETARGGG